MTTNCDRKLFIKMSLSQEATEATSNGSSNIIPETSFDKMDCFPKPIAFRRFNKILKPFSSYF
uniref:Uncharacterized protein n=1 Tax=Manihot esculenta TaxID=3983 RepID=A0A2C9UZI3_MANES